MSKNIVLITGSPRKNGNCDCLSAAFTEGAKSTGNTVIQFNAGRMNIKPCKGCQYCVKHDGICIQKDDMQTIHTALREADILVLASPVYWYDVTAQMKIVIDRMYVEMGKPFPIKESALLLCCGDTDESTAGGAVSLYNLILDYEKWQDLGILIATNVNEIGDIQGHPALKKANELGKSIS